MEAFPLQSNFLGYDEQGNPIYDRAVGADFMHEREKLFYTNGIFPNPSDNFQVMIASGMAVNVQPGTCFIQGVTGIEINKTALTIAPAEDLTNRTDSVVLRCDFVNRLIDVTVVKGTTTLTRNSNVWELKLAEITVPKMAISLSQSHITDTRLGAECGIVSGAVKTVDTKTLYQEYYTRWQEVKALMAKNEAAYSLWYEGFKAMAETTFGQRITDMDAWFAEYKQKIFDAKYFDFDNWAYRAGYTYESLPKTITATEKVYTTNIINTATKAVYATKTETKNLATGVWVTHVVCAAMEIDVTATESKEADGKYIMGVV